MRRDDFELLQRPDVQAIIEENLDDDPARVALRKGIPPAVVTQLKYLRRARAKLPAWYAARCILPPRAFEQASSSAVAGVKRFSGARCIDLTCGLGVDAAHFAAHFEQVIAVERDSLLADIARYNFERLGLRNIEVVNASAKDFLSKKSLRADLIYADPDRRSEANRKLVLLEDCTPNVVELHARMHQIAPKVVVKCSPLFDPAEAFRRFGEHTKVSAVSLRDECKEILIETGAHIPRKTIAAIAVKESGVEQAEWPLETPPTSSSPAPPAPHEARWLLLPDVALRKMGMAPHGYAFADELPGGGMYRAWEIEAVHPYKPKQLKKMGLRHLTIMQRDFPLSNARIAAQLHIKEGGERTAAFFTIAGKPYVAFLLPSRA